MNDYWRVGRKVGRTIYKQLGPEPSDDDELIGVMDTPELALVVVESVNRMILQCRRTVMDADDAAAEWHWAVDGATHGYRDRAQRAGVMKLRRLFRRRLGNMRDADPDGRNVGPPEIHESVDGGASRLQMHLLGEGHHPRCQHYEWGPCTCARLRGDA